MNSSSSRLIINFNIMEIMNNLILSVCPLFGIISCICYFIQYIKDMKETYGRIYFIDVLFCIWNAIIIIIFLAFLVLIWKM